MTQEFPVAVIGAGVIGRSHIERVLRTPGFELVGVAEPSPEGARWCETRLVPVFEHHEALLDHCRPAGVIVATPNATHLDVAATCLARGVPVLIEKPVTDTLAAAERLIALERGHGVPVLVGHHRRHNPIVQRARQCIEDGQLGQVLTATALAHCFKPPGYFDMAWRRSPGGGPVLINLIHDIDMLLYLLGPATQVQACASHAQRHFEVEDTAAALIRFERGTLATLTVSDTAASPWNWDLCAGEQPQYPRQATQSHFLCGTEASLSLPDLSLWRYRDERHWHHELTREQTAVHPQDPYLLQLEHFAAVARGDAAPLCSALEGWRTLQASLAVLAAARSGEAQACASLPSPGLTG